MGRKRCSTDSQRAEHTVPGVLVCSLRYIMTGRVKLHQATLKSEGKQRCDDDDDDVRQGCKFPFMLKFLLFCLFRMKSRNACEWIINTFSGEKYPGECRMEGRGKEEIKLL